MRFCTRKSLSEENKWEKGKFSWIEAGVDLCTGDMSYACFPFIGIYIKLKFWRREETAQVLTRGDKMDQNSLEAGLFCPFPGQR